VVVGRGGRRRRRQKEDRWRMRDRIRRRGEDGGVGGGWLSLSTTSE